MAKRDLKRMNETGTTEAIHAEDAAQVHAEDAARSKERERVEFNRRAGYGEQAPFPSFRRTVRPGAVSDHSVGARWVPLYVTIEWHAGEYDRHRYKVGPGIDGSRLSITGVEGPKPNGDAWGSCGQCGVAVEIEPYTENGWDAEMCRRLGELWDRWHMNDMRAGCAHVPKSGPGSPGVMLDLRPLTWGPTYHTVRERVMAGLATPRDYREYADVWTPLVQRLTAAHGPKHPDLWGEDGERALAAGLVKETPEKPGEIGYQERTKAAGLVYPSEHPSGLLTRPCAVCGVKYGAAWLSEPVPVEVLEWLAALPTAGAEAIPARWAHTVSR